MAHKATTTKLAPSQDKAYERLRRLIVEFTERSVDRRGDTDSTCDVDSTRSTTLSREERYATFALLGGRGTGKSTLVERLREDLKRCPMIHVCDVLDCTSLPDDIHFGVSLGEHLARCMKREQDEGSSIAEEVRSDLIKAFLPLDPKFRELKLSLAITASEYEEIAKKELTASQKAREKVDKIVEKVIGSRDKVRKILVILEDADLSVGRLDSRLLSVFLNHLGHEHLMFLVVADEEHLEHRLRREATFASRSRPSNAKAADDDSDPTAFRMLEKLIPVNHRVYLGPWTQGQTVGFRPFHRTKKESKSLGELLQTVVSKLDCEHSEQRPRMEDLLLLFPTTPRGLSDLYRRLDALCTRLEEQEKEHRRERDETQGDERTDEKLTWPELLSILAHCRGEHSLGRRLAVESLHWNATHLAWDEKKLAQSGWPRIAHEARSLQAIWALKPTGPLMKGARRGDQDALWAEIFLADAFRHDYSFLTSVFVEQFEPLAEKIEQCSSSVMFTGREASNVVGRQPHLLHSPWLRWSLSESASGGHSVSLAAGWSLLFHPDGHAMHQGALEIADRYQIGEIDAIDRVESHEIAPKDPRSLIILVDSLLQEVPWAKLTDRVRSKPAWHRIPAALSFYCLRAYRHALEICHRREVELQSGKNDSTPVGLPEGFGKLSEPLGQGDVDFFFDEPDDREVWGRVEKLVGTFDTSLLDQQDQEDQEDAPEGLQGLANHPVTHALETFLRCIVQRDLDRVLEAADDA